VAKALAGVAPEREIPPFAGQTFRAWLARRANPPAAEGRRRVLLWPDTFTNYFQPQIGRAAVEVLEAAGLSVEVPPGDLCCGRPLYDYGMLDAAQHLLRRTVRALTGPIRQGLHVVVLEPSCGAVFRDELPNLLPGEPDALRLSRQTDLLAETLTREAAPDFLSGRLSGGALVQPHCHQRALFGVADDEALLLRLGLDARILDAGCCGMAGAFGFERGARHALSLRCAERDLAPQVREAGSQTRIVADGFSCREQIRQRTGRRAAHLAQVLQDALNA
jgi:Fe-S oxidoreductase